MAAERSTGQLRTGGATARRNRPGDRARRRRLGEEAGGHGWARTVRPELEQVYGGHWSACHLSA
ncbi:hypothetical protein, partial [Streptomyces sp. NPDC096012]|uniref:hypothetical protein n=1 Tax=Streptomyces sp. NPDC096012 TaxID=3155684 RepID=UPI00336A1F08